MMVVVFRSRLRPDVDLPTLEQAGMRMYELAASMPGFVSYKEFAAEDGESLALVEFAGEEELKAWRDHPEHAAIQAHGRTSVFESYDISVCEIVRRYGFEQERGRFDLPGAPS